MLALLASCMAVLDARTIAGNDWQSTPVLSPSS